MKMPNAHAHRQSLTGRHSHTQLLSIESRRNYLELWYTYTGKLYTRTLLDGKKKTHVMSFLTNVKYITHKKNTSISYSHPYLILSDEATIYAKPVKFISDSYFSYPIIYQNIYFRWYRRGKYDAYDFIKWLYAS